jgi:ADP-glucose pyrophosphorylase
MAGARIKKGAKVHNAIVAPDAIVGEKQEINLGKTDVILVSGGSYK